MTDKNRSLSTHFSKAKINTALIVTLSASAFFIPLNYYLQGRPLTDGEIKLSQSVFKNSIDYSKVFIHKRGHNPFQKNNEPMSPNGEIYYAGKYLDDFSKSNNDLKSQFVHEMTHVWQYQNNVLHPVIAAISISLQYNFDYIKAYKFDLTEHNDLIDYDSEQQARIVQSSFRLRAYKCQICLREKQFGKILAKFRNDPTYARQPNLIRRSINRLVN